jgi:hypothetical protein
MQVARSLYDRSPIHVQSSSQFVSLISTIDTSHILEYYEIIPTGRVRLFFDIDYTKSEGDIDPGVTVTFRLKTFLQNRCPTASAEHLKMVVLSAHRKLSYLGNRWKLSYHIHFPYLFCESILHLKNLVQDFKQSLSGDYGVDTTVYAANRKFRCALQLKKKDPATRLVFDGLTESFDIEDTIISYIDEDNSLSLCVDVALQSVRQFVQPIQMAASDSESEEDVHLQSADFSELPNSNIVHAVVQTIPKNTSGMTMDTMFEKKLVSYAMYCSLKHTYMLKRKEFSKHGINWPENPLFRFKCHNGIIIYHEFTSDTGCGHLNHYHPHSQGNRQVAFYFYPLELMSRIRCFACDKVEYFHVNSKFDACLQQGQPPLLQIIDFQKNVKSNPERLHEALKFRATLHFVIEDKGVLYQFDNHTKIYEEIVTENNKQKQMLVNTWVKSCLRCLYRLYANVHYEYGYSSLINAEDNVKEDKLVGVLSRLHYKYCSTPCSFEEKLLTIPVNCPDPSKISRSIAYYLPLSDGTKVDLRSKKITKRTADDLFLQTTNVKLGEENVAEAEKFFKSLLIPKEQNEEFDEQFAYFKCLIGYLITGLTNERCVIICLGEGRNGKSVFNDVIKSVMGKFAGQLPAAFIRQERSSTQEGHSTTLLTTKTHRISFVSELDHGELMDCSKIKGISGGDEQKARAAHSSKIRSFTPTTTLVISSNYHPDFGNDGAVDDRVLYMAFNRRFCDPSENIAGDLTKAYANQDLIHRLLENRNSVCTLLVDYAHYYLKCLKESGKSAILRDMCPASFKEIRQESKAYNLEQVVLDYFEPLSSVNVGNEINVHTLSCEAFNFILLHISNDLEKKGNKLVSFNRLLTEVKRLKIKCEDEIRTFKEKVKKVRKERDENGRTTKKQFNKYFILGWTLKSEGFSLLEGNLLLSATYELWMHNVVEKKVVNSAGYFGPLSLKKQRTEHIY